MLTNRLYIYHIREKWKNMLDKNLKGKGKASNTYIAEQNIFTYKGNALNNKNDISCANFLRIFIYFFFVKILTTKLSLYILIGYVWW